MDGRSDEWYAEHGVHPPPTLPPRAEQKLPAPFVWETVVGAPPAAPTKPQRARGCAADLLRFTVVVVGLVLLAATVGRFVF